MGIYDREYSREDSPGLFVGGPRTAVSTVLLVTIGVYLVQLVFDTKEPPYEFTRFLGLERDVFTPRGLLSEPWQVLGLITHGFVHDRANIWHIVGNMFVFWFFGRELEALYGKRRFLGLYLTAIVLAGLTWIGAGYLTGHTFGYAVGASGGVAALVVLYIFHFPKRTLLLYFVIPMPAWVLGVVWFLLDLRGAMGMAEQQIAYSAHLGGAAYGVLFFFTGWSFSNLWPGDVNMHWLKSLRRGPNLKVHDPDHYERSIGDQVDEILRKIHEQGQDSLTAEEQQILEDASRRYQQKHR